MNSVNRAPRVGKRVSRNAEPSAGKDGDEARGASSYEKIFRVVKQIPKGRVASYGQVAGLAGLPGRARQVGYALHAASEELEIPWQRVIYAKGEISLPTDEGQGQIQRQMLEREGILFDERGRIDLTRYGWMPRCR